MSIPLLAYAVGQWEGYRPAACHWLIADTLERVEAGQCKRLMIFMPPRHGKSILASENFPAWWLGRNPDKYIIAATYAQDIADDFGRKVRNHCETPQHRALFPGFELDESSRAVARFHTSKGGVYFGVGVGGPATSRGAHLLLIDDPLKGRKQADSDVERKNLQDWYTAVARTRLMPDGAIVVIQTRWHEADLAGWLLTEHAHEGWEVINLPALAEEGDSLGREVGAALWPEAYPLNELESLQRAMGGASSREWTALYQQRPTSQEGAIFKRGFVNFFKLSAPPKFSRFLLSADTAFKEKQESDFSVILAAGVCEQPGRQGVYLLDRWKEQAGYPELRVQAKLMGVRWNPQAFLVEDKASGQSLVQDLRRDTMLPVVAIKPEGDKVYRANLVVPSWEAGRVFVPEDAPWTDDFLAQLYGFPRMPHDDDVDALTQLLNYLTLQPAPIQISAEALMELGIDPSVLTGDFRHA